MADWIATPAPLANVPEAAMLPFVARLEPAGLPPSRRDWLRLGVPAVFAPFARADAPRPSGGPGFGKAKSVVVIFTSGGQSQLDTWDPKPDAPAEIRGIFGTIPTRVPGLRVCELMPRLAALADKYAVLRTMTHDDLDHGSACYLALTGQHHAKKSSNPPPRPTDFPALGAVLKRYRPTDRFPHTAVHVNGPLLTPLEPGPGQYGGFLGRAYEPAEIGNVLSERLLEGLELPADVPADRLKSRRELLGRLDPSATSDVLVRQGFDLVNAPQVRTAFDLDRESAKVRDRYGRHRSGQACLMARRLVEAGVPWVTVFFNHGIRGQDDHPEDTDAYGWDTHNDIFEAMETHLLPRFDHSVSAFLEDLAQRGLLQSTLVVVMGEFGRAPLVAVEKSFAGRGSPGRKHWGGCYSVVLAGAGVVPGAVVGKSDRFAAYPQSDPTTPGDLSATMFHALGIDANAHYTDATNRPYRLTTGNPVTKLFG